MVIVKRNKHGLTVSCVKISCLVNQPIHPDLLHLLKYIDIFYCAQVGNLLKTGEAVEYYRLNDSFVKQLQKVGGKRECYESVKVFAGSGCQWCVGQYLVYCPV